MTARQIIDEIKIMAPEDREQVAAFLRQMKSGEGSVNDNIFEKTSDRVLDRHAELMRKLAL